MTCTNPPFAALELSSLASEEEFQAPRGVERYPGEQGRAATLLGSLPAFPPLLLQGLPILAASESFPFLLFDPYPFIR